VSAPGRRSWNATRLAAVGAGLLIAGACLESSIVQVQEEEIVEFRLNVDSAQVGIDRTLQVQALSLDALGRLLVGLDIAWTSTSPATATVDGTGLVTGVAPGSTQIIASFAGMADTAFVEVLEPPVLVLSADSAAFSTAAGGADPAPDTIQITNGGVFPLEDLVVDSIVYDQATSGWITAVLGGTSAPTELEITVATSGITTATTYTGSVWLSGTDAVDSPAEVRVVLEITPAAAATIEISAGDGQTGEVGLALPVDPSVLVKDAFDNPVPGLEVVFAVTGGGGSVTGSPDTTDVSGIATVGSWILGGTVGANSLDATLASVGTVSFTATGQAGAATKLQIVAGTGQSAVAGSAVSTSPGVIALDAFDNPIQGVDVVFSVQSGGGSITGGTQTTDVAGIATAGTWTLGTLAGPNTVAAVAASIPDTVTFTATGLPGGIATIVLVAGNAQTDTVAATLATDYAVRVEDINTNGIPGVTVSWQVTGGGGSITGTSDTDGTGVAVATRVLGTAVGANTAIATIGGVMDTVTFNATATVGTPAKLVAVAGTGQSATVATNVTTPPSVIVSDKFDNPVSGHSVTFAITSAGGSISPAGAQVTAANGTASLTSWTLGTLAATASDTIEVTAAGGSVAPNPLRFTATANPGAPATLSIVQGNGQVQITGSNVTQAPSVRVADQYGNGVPNVTVNFSPSGSGSVGTSAASTNSSGVATTTWAVNVGGHSMGTDGTYANTLTASSTGVTNQQFAGYARYSYPTHVDPVWAGCTGCHSGTGGTGFSGLSLGGTAAQNHGELVRNSAPNCDATLTTWRRARTDGGDSGHSFSIVRLFMEVAPNDFQGNCGPHSTKVTGTNLEIIRAWIRNGAPAN